MPKYHGTSRAAEIAKVKSERRVVHSKKPTKVGSSFQFYCYRCKYYHTRGTKIYTAHRGLPW